MRDLGPRLPVDARARHHRFRVHGTLLCSRRRRQPQSEPVARRPRELAVWGWQEMWRLGAPVDFRRA